MQPPAINPRLAPLLRSQRALGKLRPAGKNDATKLITWACVAIAAIIALGTLTLSSQVHPTDFAIMAAHP